MSGGDAFTKVINSGINNSIANAVGLANKAKVTSTIGRIANAVGIGNTDDQP